MSSTKNNKMVSEISLCNREMQERNREMERDKDRQREEKQTVVEDSMPGPKNPKYRISIYAQSLGSKYML